MNTGKDEMTTTNTWGACEVCQLPIGPDDDASIELPPMADLQAAEEAWKAHRRDPGPEAPPRVHWRLVHDACSDRANSTAYDITLDEFHAQGLTHWTNHLRSKHWFALTDWDDLARKVAA